MLKQYYVKEACFYFHKSMCRLMNFKVSENSIDTNLVSCTSFFKVSENSMDTTKFHVHLMFQHYIHGSSQGQFVAETYMVMLLSILS